MGIINDFHVRINHSGIAAKLLILCNPLNPEILYKNLKAFLWQLIIFFYFYFLIDLKEYKCCQLRLTHAIWVAESFFMPTTKIKCKFKGICKLKSYTKILYGFFFRLKNFDYPEKVIYLLDVIIPIIKNHHS